MLLALLYKWWYGAGWKRQFKRLPEGAKSAASAFSVTILLRTMFDPWKRIVSGSYVDTALDDKIKAMIDNLISRTVGFFVRLMTLFVALLAILANITYRLTILVVWPLLPLLPIILLLGALAEVAS